MPITGRFEADFSAFQSACDAATVKLTSFQANAGKVEASLTKMANSLSGTALIQQATLMATAVDKIGGVSQLTASELQRLGTQAQEAIAKMQARGITAIPKSLQDIADAAKQASHATEANGLSFEKMVGSYVTGQAIIGLAKEGFSALTGFLTDSIKAAGEAEKAHTQLVAALRAQGTAIPSVVTAYSGYATQLQRTTIYQDDAIESAEALLVQIGNVMPRDMQRALQATTDLASGLGIDLDSAVRLVGKSAEGNVSSLKKVGVIVDEVKLKHEGFGAVLDAITAKFGGQAAAIAGTYEGRLAQLGNTWNNVEESVGRAITTNATVLALFDNLNRAIDSNTGELRDNATVTNVVSGAVILAAQSVGLFARGLDTIQTFAVGVVIGLLDIDTALGKIALAAVRASAALALARGDLNGYRIAGVAVQNLQASLASEDATIATLTAHSSTFGTALQGMSAEATALAARLEATRGQVVALTDRTDGGADAWTRHTTAVNANAEELKKAESEAKKLAEEQKKLLRDVLALEHGFDVTGLAAAKLGEIGEHVAVKLHTLNEEIEGLQVGGQFGAASLLKLGGTIAASPGAIASAQLAGIGVLPDVSAAVDVAQNIERVKVPADELAQTFGTMASALQDVGRISGGTFGHMVGQLANAANAAQNAARAVQEFNKPGATQTDKFNSAVAFGAGALSTAESISASAKAHYDANGNPTGGGVGSGALSGAASGALYGAALGPIGAAAGAVVGALVGAISAATGPSIAELQTRSNRSDAFTNAGLGDLNTKGGGAAIQAAEDQLTRLGVSAQQAQILVGRALDAKTPAAFAAAMKPVNDAIALNAKLNADVNAVTSLVGAFTNAGHVLPASMVATIQSLAQLPTLTEDERKSLQALVDTAKPNFESLEGIAEKYGTTLQGLGPKLSQGQIDHTAQGIYQDFLDLTNAGGEAGNVIGAMQGKLGDLVKEAEDSGQAVPAFLKDILGNFGDTIKDSHGDLIDLTKIKFDDTPTADGLDGMQKSLDTLQGTLTHGVPDALDALLRNIPSNPFAGWAVPSVPSSEGGASNAWTGGMVRAFGVGHFSRGNVLNFPGSPSGTDTVPAWLTPGEMVLTRAQQQGLFGRGSNVVDFAEMRAELQAQRDEVRKLRSDITRTLPAAIGVAVRDNMQQGRGRRAR